MFLGASDPGVLASLDDFYAMDSGLGMVQTSNPVYNNSRSLLVKAQSLVTWLRVRAANVLASSGAEWGAMLGRNFSGTYPNQYMITDYSRFTPGQPLRPGTLTVVEEIPGMVVSGDVTPQLERGYWPSYNVPYWPAIYAASDVPAIVAKHGPSESYDLAPRAKIFRRDQGGVVDFGKFKALMRSNHYKTDPFADGHACNQICCRGDLEITADGKDTAEQPMGCYDAKARPAGIPRPLHPKRAIG